MTESPSSTPPIAVTCSRYCIPWLYEQQISFALTTYQTHRLFLIGLKPEGRLSLFERLFERAMGLAATDNRLFLGTRYQLWQFENIVPPQMWHNDYDRVYVPRLAYTTGELDIHDIAVDDSDRVVFVNTLYSCLATVSDRYSFTPVWQPPFISKLAPEDRCHLNGLAMVNGQPRYVTSLSRADVTSGWRSQRRHSGCIIDVTNNEILLDRLCMPHSPRWYRGKLWVLQSGTGELGYIDLDRGQFEPIAFCPGYLRGLAFYQDWAVVALSQPRDRVFRDLPLQEQLEAKGATPRCGLYIINLNTGNIDHWLEIEGVISELYDVQVLTNCRTPMSLGFKTDEICYTITVDPQSAPQTSPQTATLGQIFPDLTP
ncbi:MAG: TIGR03032 family protein [Jaaginema sp. PMC 1079.18]|nr:TIGR03032 family protein [Jaaginema sp. PMC 1080.18]MEC4852781.1 TIGR03032 family protein [Jaaginema sp. PMC 1079.18]MEC4868796.1 TIGR03032 family protein [Jaaginema sp. PMC 1078.18]